MSHDEWLFHWVPPNSVEEYVYHALRIGFQMAVGRWIQHLLLFNVTSVPSAEQYNEALCWIPPAFCSSYVTVQRQVWPNYTGIVRWCYRQIFMPPAQVHRLLLGYDTQIAVDITVKVLLKGWFFSIDHNTAKHYMLTLPYNVSQCTLNIKFYCYILFVLSCFFQEHRCKLLFV